MEDKLAVVFQITVLVFMFLPSILTFIFTYKVNSPKVWRTVLCLFISLCVLGGVINGRFDDVESLGLMLGIGFLYLGDILERKGIWDYKEYM